MPRASSTAWPSTERTQSVRAPTSVFSSSIAASSITGMPTGAFAGALICVTPRSGASFTRPPTVTRRVTHGPSMPRTPASTMNGCPRLRPV